MYTLNEKVVYPGHGVAKINKVIEKRVGDHTLLFYELKFINKDMTILLPISSTNPTGVRPLCTLETIMHVFEVLAEPSVKKRCVSSSWNKRCKQYQFKIQSGDVFEISKIYRDLQCMSKEKELSFGERNLLLQTEALLVEEISLVKNMLEEKAVQELRAVFRGSNMVHDHSNMSQAHV